MHKRIDFLGLPIDVLTMGETVNIIERAIQQQIMLHHVVVNAAKVVNSINDRALRESIVNCDIINADGQSIVWASRLLGKPLPERVAGIDLMMNLVEMAADKGYKIFLLGAKDDVLRKVVSIYQTKYGDNVIAGFRNGYFKEHDEWEVANQIANSKANMLFVAITSPKKEVFLNKYKDIIKTPFIMGVGGSFDVIAGKVNRAPLWMQKSGLEWLFRVIQEPRRMWKRYLITNSAFIYMVLKEKFSFKQN
ncbi:MAG: glycosyltransferase [Flavobacterium sp.]|nr:MAG: glycosyltransferase [Flavobacterium sp.]